MEITGKIIAVLPLLTGMSKNGSQWKKQEYVIETIEQYPKKCCFNLWGDKVDYCAIQLGEELTVSFDIDCREWNGKWFNEIRAWKVDRKNNSSSGYAEQKAEKTAEIFPPHPTQTFDPTPTDPKDDLPF